MEKAYLNRNILDNASQIQIIYNLAILYSNFGNSEKALSMCSKTKELLDDPETDIKDADKRKLLLTIADIAKTSAIELASNTYASGKGIAFLSTALEVLKPGSDSELLFHRGTMYLNINYPEYAMEHFNQSIQLNQEDDRSFSCRAHCHYILDQHNDALEDAEKALDINRNNALALFIKARILRETGNEDYKTIMHLLDSAYKNSEGRTISFKINVLNEKSILLCKKGRYRQAIREYKKILNSIDDIEEKGRIFSLIGRLHAQGEDYKHAMRFMKRAIKTNEKDLLYHAYKALLHLLQNNLEEFAQELTITLALLEQEKSQLLQEFSHLDINKESLQEDYQPNREEERKLFNPDVIAWFQKGKSYRQQCDRLTNFLLEIQTNIQEPKENKAATRTEIKEPKFIYKLDEEVKRKNPKQYEEIHKRLRENRLDFVHNMGKVGIVKCSPKLSKKKFGNRIFPFYFKDPSNKVRIPVSKDGNVFTIGGPSNGS